jgi:hypothetical protein
MFGGSVFFIPASSGSPSKTVEFHHEGNTNDVNLHTNIIILLIILTEFCRKDIYNTYAISDREGMGMKVGCVRLVRRVRGVMGELERSVAMEKEMVNLEVLSVGRLFREMDHRYLHRDVQKPPFCRQEPKASILS